MHNTRTQLAGALALLLGGALWWLAHDTPWQPVPLLRVDALAALGVALALLGFATAPGDRAALAFVVLAASFCTPLLPLAGTLFVLGMIGVAPVWQVAARGTRIASAALWMGAAGALVGGYWLLVRNGAIRYDTAPPDVLTSAAFWWVLVGAAVPVLLPAVVRETPATIIARLLWLLPLARLLSLGTWNTGWNLATALLGAVAALLAAGAALAAPRHSARQSAIACAYAALGLATLGLTTGAGLAALCGCLLAALLAVVPGRPVPATGWRTLLPWLLVPLLPFGLPFVTIWLGVSAAVASGGVGLAAAVWLVALLINLAAVVRGWNAPGWACWLSLALGVLTPVWLRWLAGPLIAQLQPGLSVYGDLVIWPWVGVAAENSARQPVATLPSVAVAGLLVVLLAIVALTRLVQTTPPDSSGDDTFLPTLRAHVPWLDALLSRRHDPR